MPPSSRHAHAPNMAQCPPRDRVWSGQMRRPVYAPSLLQHQHTSIRCIQPGRQRHRRARRASIHGAAQRQRQAAVHPLRLGRRRNHHDRFPHILVRASTILFHMFDLRLLIQADKLLLFHVDGLADTTISQVFTYNLQDKLQGHHVLHRKMSEAFELRALEAALAAVAAGLEAGYLLVRRDVGAALRELDAQMADKEEASVHTGLRELLDMARRLADIEQQARLVRGALGDLLREDRDMADLYLTDRRSGRRHEADDHEEVEYLFEAYFRAHDAVVQEASALMANVHRTADTVRSILANRRNQIMILETKVEIAMLGMASATLVAGWYGMNTVNFLEESLSAFAVIVSGSVLGGGAIWWFLLRKLRSIRRKKM
ncbi:inner membrane magnesium transporter mrs2 [Beauveria bassiana D1-5]|uniref:Magnesium transporter n=1 Tax=Beauveria bassiana D1-5 TaxID=1245745 RepID=A0A0A2VH25_BEABA|nr:inner membrane magnesium transporter mrs2 [Beauveria bassiana D1-5]